MHSDKDSGVDFLMSFLAGLPLISRRAEECRGAYAVAYCRPLVRRRMTGLLVTTSLFGLTVALVAVVRPEHFRALPDPLPALLVAAYIAVIGLLVIRVAFAGVQTPVLELDEERECLRVPRLLFPGWSRVAKLTDVSFVDWHEVRGNPVLLLAIRHRHPVVIDGSLLEHPAQLERLAERLEAMLGRTPDGRRLGPAREALAQRSKESRSNGLFIAGLCAVLVAAYFLTAHVGGGERSIDPRAVELGANTGAALRPDQIYRLFCASILHFNFEHLLFNLVALCAFGEMVVRSLGAVRFFNIVLASSAGGMFLSALSLGENASVGVSGAVFGVLGAYIAVQQKYGAYLPPVLNLIPNRVLALILLPQFVLGFLLDVIDGWNHLGGFLVGCALIHALASGRNLVLDPPSVGERTSLALLATACIASIAWFLQLYLGAG